MFRIFLLAFSFFAFEKAGAIVGNRTFLPSKAATETTFSIKKKPRPMLERADRMALAAMVVGTVAFLYWAIASAHFGYNIFFWLRPVALFGWTFFLFLLVPILFFTAFSLGWKSMKLRTRRQTAAVGAISIFVVWAVPHLLFLIFFLAWLFAK